MTGVAEAEHADERAATLGENGRDDQPCVAQMQPAEPMNCAADQERDADCNDQYDDRETHAR